MLTHCVRSILILSSHLLLHLSNYLLCSGFRLSVLRIAHVIRTCYMPRLSYPACLVKVRSYETPRLKFPQSTLLFRGFVGPSVLISTRRPQSCVSHAHRQSLTSYSTTVRSQVLYKLINYLSNSLHAVHC